MSRTDATPKPMPTAPSRVAARDAGVSFLELLVAVVLLGTAGVAVLVSMSAAAVGARTSDEIADVQSLLAEAIVAVGDTDPERVPYVPCDSATTPLTAYAAAVDGMFDGARGGDVDVVTVRYWNSDTQQFGAACRYGEGDRLQEVEILATYGVSSRSAVVVKRPSNAPTAGLGSIPPLDDPNDPTDPVGPGFADVELTPGING